MKKDPELSIFCLFVPESVLDFVFGPRFGASEVVVAHGNCEVASQLSLVVLKHDIRPALAAVNGETGVLRRALS